MNNDEFLKKLQKEAKLQKSLNETRLLPKQLDFLTSFIGNYSLFSILFLTTITVVIIEFWS